MPVEIGELEVVAPPAQNGAARGEGAGAPATSAASSSQVTIEVERALALEHTRDMRLRAD